MKTITTKEELKKYIKLTPKEEQWIPSETTVPLKITDHYIKLINQEDENDPLRKQVIPNSDENITLPEENIDPLQEVNHSPYSRLIHRYKNRCAFLVTDICPQYCRHCFRRRFTGKLLGEASIEETEKCSEYIAQNPEISEILFTGGDPLTLSDDKFLKLIEIFRKKNPNLIIRICTRYPVSKPERITEEFVKKIKSFSTAPFYLMTQFNHPKELSNESKIAIDLFVDNGIPAMNQTVLLKGVNDNTKTLAELSKKLIANRIKPYYLFQGDLVTGTSHFRVPIEKGLKIEKELRQILSGLEMPVYAVDLPDGGGKIPLSNNYIIKKENNTWYFKTPDGMQRTYTEPQF